MTQPIPRDAIYRRRVFDAEGIELCVRRYIAVDAPEPRFRTDGKPSRHRSECWGFGNTLKNYESAIEDIEVRDGGNSATARAIDRCLTRNCTVCTVSKRNHVKNSAQRL
jgi:hypothetical protein